MRIMKNAPSQKINWRPIPLVCFLPVALLLTSIDSHAQTAAKPVFPEGPILDSAPDPSQWVITYSYPQERAKTPPPPGFTESRTRTITTTKVGRLMHEEIVDARGGIQDSWHIGPDAYAKWSGAPMWTQVRGNTSTSASGFPDLDWISKDNYVGSAQYSGHKCLVFVLGAPAGFNVSSPGFTADKLDTFQRVAFIEADSRLPLEVRSFGDYGSYRFAAAPTEQLIPPADLLAQIKHDRDVLSRLGGQVPAGQ